MSSLTSPILTGYSTVYPIGATSALYGLTKGTYFWECSAGDPYNSIPLLGKSSDGFTWTEQLTTALAEVSVIGYTSVVVACPVSIDDVMVCYLQVIGGDSAGLWFLKYNGSLWTKADASGYVNYAATNYNLPLTKANGLFFILGMDGLYSSTDGSTWVQRINLTDEEPGGPNYAMQDVIYKGSTYYAIARVTYPIGGETVFRYTSSNLTDWTSYTTALPSGTTLGRLERIFAGATEFYLQGDYYLLKSSDFITWNVHDYVASGVNFKYFNLDLGFVANYNNGYLLYVPNSKSDLTIILENTPEQISYLISAYGVQKEVIIYNGYVFGAGSSLSGTYTLWAFKYDDTWDNGNGAPDRSGVLSATSGSDTATITGMVQVYTNTIQGTLRLDTSDGVFAARKVYLYNYTTGLLMDETTSDAITGAWEFTAVAPGYYFVVGAATSDDYVTYNRDFDALGVITVV